MKSLMKGERPENLRKIGSLSLVAGYVLLVMGLPDIGLPVRLLGNLTMLPFAIKLKMRDVTLMQIFFGLITAGAMVPNLAAGTVEGFRNLPQPLDTEITQNHYGI